jgi:hypothetical protein
MTRVVKRRMRVPHPAKPGELKVVWGKLESYDTSEELVYLYGGWGAYKGHSITVMDAFQRAKVGPDGETLAAYLAACGFDMTTLKFSIRRTEPRGRDGSLQPGSSASVERV